MEKKRYEEIVKEYLSEYEIEKVDELPDLIRVAIRPCKRGWGRCIFIFDHHHITCFGDVEAFTWNVTWDAASQIKRGNCNAKNFSYLTKKLEHKDRLEEFEFDEKIMKELKEELTEDMDEDELDEFNEKWSDNEYLLDDISEYHLDGLDEFFEEIGVSDGWEYYGRFEELPNHYYCAVAMLRCIEDYFENRVINAQKGKTIPETFDFGEALKRTKTGKKVARIGWNGKGQFVYYIPADRYVAKTEAVKSIADEDGKVAYRAYLALKTAQGDIATWVPSISDCLAEDWCEVE